MAAPHAISSTPSRKSRCGVGNMCPPPGSAFSISGDSGFPPSAAAWTMSSTRIRSRRRIRFENMKTMPGTIRAMRICTATGTGLSDS